MEKIYDDIADINDDINDDTDEETPGTGIPPGQKAFLALTNSRVPVPMRKNGFTRSSTTTTLTESRHFGLEEATSFRQALVRSGKTVTLDPDRIDPHLFMLQDLPSPEAEKQYRKLAVNLITASARRQFKRILFVSAHHGEGRTSVMLNLAGALARAKLRVLVVDSDFSRPSVMRLLGLDSETGIAEVFASNKQIGEAAVTLRPLGITALVTREAIDNPAEILASPAFHEMLSLFEPEFDFVLFDSPPLLDSADANLLTQIVDTTLMVVRPNTTTAGQMGKAVALLSQEDISGVVINRTTRK